MKDQRDLDMFGCTHSDLLEMLEDSIGSYEMLAMAIMSDAQHVMAHGDTETARQFINKAKWVVYKIMETRRAA